MLALVNRGKSTAWWLVIAAVYAFLLAPTLVIVVFSFYPSAYIVFPPSHLTLKWYTAALAQQSLFVGPFFTSLRLGAIAAAIATIVGTASAFVLVRRNFPFRTYVQAFFLAPILVPTLVIGFSLMLLLSSIHVLGGYPGLVLGHVVITIAYVVQSVGASLVGIDRTVEEAALSLGSTPWRVMSRVTLRLIAPGIVSGAIFAFIMSFDELPVTLFLSPPTTVTLPAEIYSYVQQYADPTVAAVSSLLALLSLTALVALQRLGGLEHGLY